MWQRDAGLAHVLAAAIAAVGIFAGSASADALEDIKAGGTIDVGIFSDFPPFSSASADMSIKGYDVDVAQKIFRIIDVLEDSDDVQNVFTNVDLTPEVEAALEAED